MHNIKDIRKDIDLFKNSLKKRFLEVDLKKILELDDENRKLIQKKENLEKEKKDISKSNDKTLFAKSKDISVQIDKLSKSQAEVKNELENILSTLPNLPLDDVPVGKMKILILKNLKVALFLNLILKLNHIMN